ncbi:hypothetical protein OKJ48_42630 [Streptomyces kunmingensis]|uniref:Four-helix bundle copper-binding protein n=1 Tax=Streptomyces kunmingensis TaxID=68225 RepID=A0ABU6CSE8_9ACTN|nr:hypothetical protein [Streptomyces kunmingensis]MEB3966886.1 hypothetical protein [Streptomyces kunmingensis]
MPQIRELIESVGSRLSVDSAILARAVTAVSACEQSSAACAAGMLADKDADSLRDAIVQNLDCADVSSTTSRLLLRGDDAQRPLLAAQTEACLIACRDAREQCGRHAAHREHCRICSETAGRAAEACEELLSVLRR